MKRTKKFIAAELIAIDNNFPINDEIYLTLETNNYFWDSSEQEWFVGEEADPPTSLIKVRVWADKAKVADEAKTIVHQLTKDHWNLEEKSEPYTCRPPKQNEARIYLTFSRK